MHHILVVDDEKMITYAIQRFLEHSGYRVTVANDGQTALNLSLASPVDGLITDFRMGRINGQELISQMRQRQSDLPAIILSAYTADITQPVDHKTKVFSKPVQLSKLVETMKEMLNNVRR